MVRIVGQGEESISLVEVPCRLVDGIDFHRANPDLRGEIFSPSECIDQQELPQFLSLYGSIHRQSPDQYDRQIDLRQVLRLICGQGFKDDGDLATEFSVTTCRSLQCRVRPGVSGVSGVKCFEETVTITIRKTSNLSVIEDLTGFSNNGRNGELTDRLPQSRSRLFNGLLQFAGQSDVDPCIISGDGCHELCLARLDFCVCGQLPHSVLSKVL